MNYLINNFMAKIIILKKVYDVFKKFVMINKTLHEYTARLVFYRTHLIVYNKNRIISK